MALRRFIIIAALGAACVSILGLYGSTASADGDQNVATSSGVDNKDMHDYH